MAKKIIWSPSSISDRIIILDYWNKKIGNKNYSKRLDNSIKKAVKLISKFPFLGRKFGDTEIRFFVKGDYQIFYKVSGEFIRILYIWDSRRNPDNLKL